MSETTQSVVPADWREIGLSMSNFDHSIDEGLEEALRECGVYSRHNGWNFNGLVWFDAESSQFKEEVWTYRVPRAVHSAPSLRELMDDVNSLWGWE